MLLGRGADIFRFRGEGGRALTLRTRGAKRAAEPAAEQERFAQAPWRRRVGDLQERYDLRVEGRAGELRYQLMREEEAGRPDPFPRCGDFALRKDSQFALDFCWGQRAE